MNYFKKSGLSEKTVTSIVFCVYVFLITYSNTAWYTFSEGTIGYVLLKIVRYMCYGIFLVGSICKFRKQQYSKEALAYLSLLLILSFIGMFTGKDNSLFLTILFFTFLFGMNSIKMIKYSFAVQGTLLALTIICALLGLADNSILDFERMRYSLGFNWSNLAPILYLFVSLQYIYIRKSKITVLECIVMEVINIILYKFTNTKMSFALLTAVLLIILFCQISSKFKNALKRLFDRGYRWIMLVPVIGAFLACWLPLYNPTGRFWNSMNAILSGRLWQCKNAIVEYGFSLFGKWIPVEVFSVTNHGASDQTYFIDSGYLHFAMKYGVIMLVLLVVMYIISIWKAYRTKDYLMIGIFITLSVFCINDIYLISAFNLFTIYVFCDEDIFIEVPLFKKIIKKIDMRLKRKES